MSVFDKGINSGGIIWTSQNNFYLGILLSHQKHQNKVSICLDPIQNYVLCHCGGWKMSKIQEIIIVCLGVIALAIFAILGQLIFFWYVGKGMFE